MTSGLFDCCFRRVCKVVCLVYLAAGCCLAMFSHTHPVLQIRLPNPSACWRPLRMLILLPDIIRCSAPLLQTPGQQLEKKASNHKDASKWWVLDNHRTAGWELTLQVHKSVWLHISLRYLVQKSECTNLSFVSEKTAFKTRGSRFRQL